MPREVELVVRERGEEQRERRQHEVQPVQGGAREARCDGHPAQHERLIFGDAPRGERPPRLVNRVLDAPPGLVRDVAHELVDPDPHDAQDEAVERVEGRGGAGERTLG